LSIQTKKVIVLTTKSVYNEVENFIHYFDTFGRGVLNGGSGVEQLNMILETVFGVIDP